ncbi:arf-GAP with coiled-coil, ANK repeat and PH domain-containing protein 1 isoform X2 [Struthio camelus]|uniref:arf-GAP with coiled-coil, ANK repeat and PH domain-containing protein 1 isoform X2 n=1 Tax=Struthio camelus TaxID=8801 RepID=UPI003603D392
MTVKLDFEECFKDSPWFRAAVEEAEAEIAEFETRLEKVLKLCSAMLDAGRHFEGTSRALAAGLRELGGPAPGDPLVRVSPKMGGGPGGRPPGPGDAGEILRILGPHDGQPRGAPGQHPAVAAPPRPHPAQGEAAAALGAARGQARARALDYVLQINVMQLKKKSEILQFVLRLMEAQATYFSQGHSAAGRLERYRAELGTQLDRLVLEAARQQRDMEQRHAMLIQQDLSQETVAGAAREAPPGAPPMEGYLYKRASNAFRTWSRRWFSIQSNQLVYIKRARDPPTVVVDDLRLCTVKPCPDLDRRFCFEVLSPSKTCLLQADSEQQQQAWLSAVQSSIASAFSEGPPPSPPGQSPEHPGSAAAGPRGGAGGTLGRTSGARGGRGGPERRVLEQVLGLEGNATCCDCREPAPEWASINLGITLCIECSGIHRSLGVHFSKVRSLTLDSWEPELVKLMCELGNSTLNRIYEARVEEMAVKRPQPGCSRAQREGWIRAKYVQKKFVTQLPGAGPGWGGRGQGVPSPSPHHSPRARPLGPTQPPGPAERGGPPNLHPGALLYWAARRQSLPTMADALAHGADPGWVNGAEESRTPLLQAVAANSLLACEFLLQNGASVNQSDSAGRGPLHHATMLGHTGLACLFLKRGADLSAVDAEGKDPLSIAIELANADIVTLLRLAKMRELEVAQGQTGDDTYLDIFRDISLMASDHPEKLARRDLKLTTL